MDRDIAAGRPRAAAVRRPNDAVLSRPCPDRIRPPRVNGQRCHGLEERKAHPLPAHATVGRAIAAALERRRVDDPGRRRRDRDGANVGLPDPARPSPVTAAVGASVHTAGHTREQRMRAGDDGQRVDDPAFETARDPRSPRVDRACDTGIHRPRVDDRRRCRVDGERAHLAADESTVRRRPATARASVEAAVIEPRVDDSGSELEIADPLARQAGDMRPARTGVGRPIDTGPPRACVELAGVAGVDRKDVDVQTEVARTDA